MVEIGEGVESTKLSPVDEGNDDDDDASADDGVMTEKVGLDALLG